MMDNIVEYLAFMLEYDENYCNELGSHNPIIKRKWIENQSRQQDVLNKLGGLKVIGNVGRGSEEAFPRNCGDVGIG